MKRPLYNAFYSLFHNPKHFVAAVVYRACRIFPDEFYLKIIIRLECGYKLDLDNPQTYNAKLQWLKLFDHRPEYTMMVDKVKVKEYIKEKLGEEYVIPTLGVWKNTDEIDIESLPNQFVLKTNHDGGNNGVVICRDKLRFDYKKAFRKLDKSLKRNPYYLGREWPYKNVERCIFAEQYMEDDRTGELRDYKFFCFDGQVKALFVATERQSGGDVKFDYFDENFTPLNIVQHHAMSGKDVEKPICFELMKSTAAKLSKGIPQVRIDFYEVNGKPYFGEMTFFHHGGFVPFHPAEWDLKFGEWIVLPEKRV